MTEHSSAERLEREQEQRREHIEETIHELQDRFSPGQMLDQAMNYMRSGGASEFWHNFGRTVRDNPVPVALVGVGLAWLMAGGQSRGRADGEDAHEMAPPYDTWPHPYADVEEDRESAAAARARRAADSVVRQAGETEETFRERLDAARAEALELGRQAGETSESFRARIEDAYHNLMERVQRRSERMAAGAASARSRAREAWSDAGDRARSGTSWAGGQTRSAARGASDLGHTMADLARRQPLLLGALGCAVGAALGSLTRPSRYEDEVFGPHRDRFFEDVGRASKEMAERAGRVGSRAAETARTAAEREGLTAEEARRAGRDVERRAERVAEETVAAAEDEVRRQSGSGGAS